MAKGARRKSTQGTRSVKSGEASPEGAVVSQPENDPIVVDNPNLRIDLINVKGLPGGDPKKKALLRKFKGLAQLVVFDSDSQEAEWRFIELEDNAPLQLVLDGNGERLIFAPYLKDTSQIQISSSKTSQFVQNALAPTQFSLDTDPQRRIAAFVCKGNDLGPSKEVYDGLKEVPLSTKGRHVVILLPKSTFGAIQLV